MAGHSKWANIKHRKARQDAKRGSAWSKCSKAIMVAAKNGGGDPATNLSLRYAIDEAKSENMPKDTIENAIKKGTGDLEGVTYESVVYEGYGPNGVAVLVDVLTDNRNRTAAEMRKLFEKGGGNLGASGCVAYIFTKQGQIFLSKDGLDEDAAMEAALEAGASDVSDADDSWQVLCDPAEYSDVLDALREQDGVTVESSSVAMIPDNTVNCEGRDAEKMVNLMEAIEEHDDVQKVFANFEIDDAELEKLNG